MKHTIRRYGQIEQIDCEIGSGILDKNGVEIENNDKVISLDMINGSVEVVGHVGD